MAAAGIAQSELCKGAFESIRLYSGRVRIDSKGKTENASG